MESDSFADAECEFSDQDCIDIATDVVPATLRLVQPHEEAPAEVPTFEEVCLELRGECVNYACGIVADRDRAEDLVQTAMLRALQAWSAFVPDGDPLVSARAWLFRIITNTFVSSYQRTRRFNAAVDRDRDSIASRTSADGDEYQTWLQLGSEQYRGGSGANELSDEVRDAVASLPPHHREVVELLYLEGLSDRDAAEQLGISIGTLCSRRTRARATLVRALKRFARENYGFGMRRPVVATAAAAG